jgi:hypothetical protein
VEWRWVVVVVMGAGGGNGEVGGTWTLVRGEIDSGRNMNEECRHMM